MEFLCKGTSCRSRSRASVKKTARQPGVSQLAVLPFSTWQGRGQAVRDVLYGSSRVSAWINDEDLAD